MEHDVIIEIELCERRTAARFYRGKEVIAEVGLLMVVNKMNEITAQVNNNEKRACLFATR